MGRPGGGILALRGHAASRARPTSRRCSTCCRATCRCRSRPRHAWTTTSQADTGSKGFWANMRKYTVSLLKAWWGDAATADNDCCYDYLPRLTGRPRHVRDRPGTDRGDKQGLLPVRPEPGRRLGRHGMQRLGLAHLDWLVVRDLELIEIGHLLEGRPGDRDRRDAHRGHRHRGVLPARRGAHGEGRQLHEDPADAAVAPQGGRTRRRRPQRPVVLLPPRPPAAREAGRVRQRDGPSAARPDLGLPGEGRAGRTRRRRRARRRSTASRRPTASRCPRTPSSKPTARPPAAAGSTAACTPTASTRRRGASPARSRPGSPRSGAGRGRPTGASSTTARRPTRTASRGASARPTSGGTPEQKKWTGHDVPDFIADRPPDYRPPEGTTGVAAISGIDPFIMQADGKAWLFAPAGLVDGPLPTHYEPQESPVRNPLYRPAAQPRAADRQAQGKPAAAERRRAGRGGLPVRVHHVPAHRASHRRRHAPVPALPGRAAARVLLRGLAGTRRRARPRAPRLGDDRHRADRDRGPGAGHRADDAAHGRRPDSPPDRPAVPLGAERA